MSNDISIEREICAYEIIIKDGGTIYSLFLTKNSSWWILNAGKSNELEISLALLVKVVNELFAKYKDVSAIEIAGISEELRDNERIVIFRKSGESGDYSSKILEKLKITLS